MLKKIKDELDIYESKIKFIEEFIAGTMKLINEDDDVINEYLDKNNYLKFSVNEKDDPSYDYLINMQIRSLTKRKIEELRKLHDKKSTEFEILSNKTDKQLWLDDLNQFEKVYQEELKDYVKRYTN